jgi:Ni/Co efflux regulator RcnB
MRAVPSSRIRTAFSQRWLNATDFLFHIPDRCPRQFDADVAGISERRIVAALRFPAGLQPSVEFVICRAGTGAQHIRCRSTFNWSDEMKKLVVAIAVGAAALAGASAANAASPVKAKSGVMTDAQTNQSQANRSTDFSARHRGHHWHGHNHWRHHGYYRPHYRSYGYYPRSYGYYPRSHGYYGGGPYGYYGGGPGVTFSFGGGRW